MSIQGHHIETSLGHQIGTSNRILRGCPGDVGGGHPLDKLGANICGAGFTWFYVHLDDTSF